MGTTESSVRRQREEATSTIPEPIYKKVPKARLQDIDTLADAHPGYGRLAFLGLHVLANFVIAFGLLGLSTWRGIAMTDSTDNAVSLLASLLALLVTAWPRLRNIGYGRGRSAFYLVFSIIPIVNLLVWLVCIIYPEGYATHRRLDTPAKVMRGILVIVFVLIVLGLVARLMGL